MSPSDDFNLAFLVGLWVLSGKSCWGPKALPLTLMNWYSECRICVSRTHKYTMDSHSLNVYYVPGNMLTAEQASCCSCLQQLCGVDSILFSI